MKTYTNLFKIIAIGAVIAVALASCGGKKDSGGGGGGTASTPAVKGTASAPAVKGKGKNWVLNKAEDFKYDLTKIDGQDYVVIKDINLPKDIKKPERITGTAVATSMGVFWDTELVDTITVNIPEKIEGYTVGVIRVEGAGGYLGDRMVTAVTIPDTVVEIGRYTFSGSSISSIKLPKNLKQLGEKWDGIDNWMSTSSPAGQGDVFSGCKNLVSITIPAGITEIPDNTFDGCESLKEVEIPDSVTTIGGWVFLNCKELTTVKLPSHPLKYAQRDEGTGELMSNDAFKGCSKLSLAARKAIQDSGYTGDF
jgi:hypothetical protein